MTKNKNNVKEEFVDQAEREEKKFQSINPTIAEDFNSRFLFWDSIGEIIARIIILIARVAGTVAGVIFIFKLSDFIINDKINNELKNIFTQYKYYIIISFVCFEAVITFIYTLPQFLAKRANAVHAWGATFIVLGILYFITMESIIVVLIIFTGAMKSFDKGLSSMDLFYIINMGIVFLIAILTIVGGAILVAKSDDVRRQLTVEN